MKKISLFSILLFTGISTTFGQVGIGTQTPKSTLDITAINPTGTSTDPDGILIPRIDRQRAQNMATVETSTLIYVNDIATGTAAGKSVNIDAIGFYSFDGTAWQKFGTGGGGIDINIYKDNGTLTSDRTVTMSDKTLSFPSTATSGTNHFSVDGSTLSVDAVNNRVGLGTITPNSTFVVEGSYEGAYKEVSANTTLTINDQFINVIGSVSRTVTLPNAITAGTTDAFIGRIYHIKNTSSQNAIVKGSATQLLRSDNSTVTNTILLLPGESVQVIKNNNYDNIANPVWDIISKAKINDGETIRSSEYAYKYFEVNSSSPTNSLITVGNISIRWPYTTLGSNQHFQIKFNDQPDLGVILVEQNGVPRDDLFVQSNLIDLGQNTWFSIPGFVFNPINADWYRTTVVKIREKAVYKITAQFNKATTANASTGRPALPAGCTIIIEKYN